jgi:hypothetical protein
MLLKDKVALITDAGSGKNPPISWQAAKAYRKGPSLVSPDFGAQSQSGTNREWRARYASS